MRPAIVASFVLLVPFLARAVPDQAQRDALMRSEETKLFFSLGEVHGAPAEVLTSAQLGFRGSGAQDPDAKDVFAALEELDREGKLTMPDMKPLSNSILTALYDKTANKKLEPRHGVSILHGAGVVLAKFDGTPRLEVTVDSRTAAAARTYSGRKMFTAGRGRTRAHLDKISAASAKKIVAAADVPDDIVFFSAKNIPWDQALDLFAEWRGLSWKATGDSITVSVAPTPAERSAYKKK